VTGGRNLPDELLPSLVCCRAQLAGWASTIDDLGGVAVSMTTWRRVGLGVPAVLVALTASACSGAGSGGTASTSRSAAVGGTPSASAQRALTTTAGALHSTIDQFTAPAGATAADRTVGQDADASCELGAAAGWPKRWGYTVTWTMPDASASAAARSVVASLQKAGWTARVNRSTSDIVDVNRRKQGMLIRVTGGTPAVGLAFEGYGPCVAADGSVVTS
jgi:hypothetical protein